MADQVMTYRIVVKEILSGMGFRVDIKEGGLGEVAVKYFGREPRKSKVK